MGKHRDEHNDRTMVERIDPLMGEVVGGRYRIDFRLASGGFGAIYRATHVKTGEQFALKVLHSTLATADARVIMRFRRESETLAQLKSPNTIHAYESGEAPDGSMFIVMELLHGESLYEQFRAKGVLPWERVVRIGRQICNSLAEAHALGVVHRDLKPANIHLEARDGNPDFVKVLDFGIAKITSDSELDSTELTQAGQMIGTFDYMAPEQMVGGQCTGKTDIYTLGVMLYEMLTGRRPFGDVGSPTAMLAALLTQTPPPLNVRGVPPELERILMKCLEREPPNRYDDVEALAADLDRLVRPDVKTIKLHTPAPVIVDSEATVVAHSRSKRGTPGDAYSEPTIKQRPRRDSDVPEPRAKRESSPPSPNIIRREGSSPAIPLNPSAEVRAKRDSSVALPEARAKRESSPPNPNVIRRDRDSQPVPLVAKGPEPTLDPSAIRREPTPDPNAIRREPTPDPGAWQSLQMPKRERESGPVARGGGRDSQLAFDKPPERTPAPAGFPPTPYPGYPNPQTYQPTTLQRTPAPVPIPQQPLHMVHPPLSPAATPDPRVQLAAVDPNAWRQPQPTPPRGSMLDARTGYDMAGSQSRDVMVRRIVWGLALVLGIILAIVVASRL